jgi:DegV family protein with EDD domain
MDLTAANTAIVVDSTADFPQAPERYPNWRIVPLYVRFGQESFRDYVELGPADFYARLRGSPVVPTTSQPTPGDFHAAYEELGEYERVYSVHIAGTLSGTVESARTAAAEFGDRIRVVDTETASGRRRDARARDPAAARAGHDRRGGRGARPVAIGASRS